MSRLFAFPMLLIAASLLPGVFAGCSTADRTSQLPNEAAKPAAAPGDPALRLGNFSVSLAVKDIAASRAFYEKLGFVAVGGDQSKNWIVLQNDSAKIGLFQGMFPRNMLTFNPGWDSTKTALPDFVDVRELQNAVKARGLTPSPAIPVADESGTGPTYFMLADPDGNPILIDQHVPSPVRTDGAKK